MATVREFPGFAEVFEIGDPVSNRPLRANFPDEWVRRSLRLTRGELRPAEPIVVRHYMGGANPSDVVWTGAAYPMLVHSRVLDVLLDHRFSGWSTYAVEVYGKHGEHFPDYHGFSFTGRCGAVHYRADSLFQKLFPAMAVPYYRGLYFDPATWDGSDLFAPVPIDGRGKETAHTFALGVVVRALRKAKVRNVQFTPAPDYESDAGWVRVEDVIASGAPEA